MSLFLSLLQPMRKWIVVTIVLTLLHTIATLSIPTLTASIINEGVLQGNLDYIQSMSLSMILLAFIGTTINVISVYCNAHISSALGQRLRQEMMQSIHSMTLFQISQFGTGSLLMRSTRDIEKIQSVVDEGLNMIIPTPFMIIIGLSLTFMMNVYLGAIVLFCMIIMLLGMYYVEVKAIPLVERVQDHVDYLTNLLRDHIIGMSVIRAFNRRTYEHDREIGEMKALAATSKQLAQLFALGFPLILLIFNICTLCIVWVGGYEVHRGQLELGNIMAVIEYATLTLISLLMAIFVFINVPEALIAFHRIKEVLDVQKETDYPTIHTSIGKEDSLPTAPLLEFKNVSFSYVGAQSPAIHNISFTIDEGTRVAIMGGIGSGKSTILQLITGLLEPTEGEILWKGIPLCASTIESIRPSLSYVPQKAHVFHQSMGANISYGLQGIQEEPVSHQSIRQAAHMAEATSFIEQFSNSFDYEVAQGGTNLSGGQRQRVAMARALLRPAELYLFDDSFSALDATTEARIRKRLRHFTVHGKTPTIMSVEQKVSAAQQSDIILLFSEGKLDGVGTHEDLLHTSQVYREIVQSQEVS